MYLRKWRLFWLGIADSRALVVLNSAGCTPNSMNPLSRRISSYWLPPIRTRGLFPILGIFASSCLAQGPELVDVGDHRLEIARSGSGYPTVVLEEGAGGTIQVWSNMLSRVGEFTSCVTYARAGRGASDPAKTPRTLAAVAEDLNLLLARSGNKPPYVLVGSSLGGIYVRAYATIYPKDTAGLVLVDGSNERQQAVFDSHEGIGPQLRVLLDKHAQPKTKDEKAAAQEFDGLSEVLATGDLGLSGTLPNLPMVVICSTRPDNGPEVEKFWRAAQTEVFESTTHGMLIVTDKSGHGIQGSEPDLVINAIRWVVDTVRAQNTASKRFVSAPRGTLQRYEGVYRWSPTQKVEFREVNGLFLLRTQEGITIRLEALSAKEFLAPDYGITFVFSPPVGTKGATVSFRNVNGDGIEATWVDERLDDPPTPYVLVDEKILDEMAGTYEFEPGFEVTVRHVGASLTEQITGQSVTDLVADTAKRFYAERGTAVFEFKLNPNGRIEGLVLLQAGVRVPAKKKR